MIIKKLDPGSPIHCDECDKEHRDYKIILSSVNYLCADCFKYLSKEIKRVGGE